MRKTAPFAVALLCLVFLSASTAQAVAITPGAPTIEYTASIFEKIFGINLDVNQETEHLPPSSTPTENELTAPEPTEPEPRPKPIRYKVKNGDTLTTIAKKHDTTWKRLYAKNRKIKHPDVLTVGEALIIPRPDEKLKKRRVSGPTANSRPANTPQRSTRSTARVTRSTTLSRQSSRGNTYYYGYCTWYAKNKRPDLPNNLGNANTWVSRAAAQGFATGSTPRVGAIGQQGMHVVYVEKVNSNGTVTVSEMNYEGFGVISSRTVPASTFYYIY